METPKKLFIFQETELFYISGKENPEKFLLFQGTSYISGSNFPSSKNNKNLLLKSFFISGNGISSPKFKKILTFQEELLKPENQINSYSLELLTYYCIDFCLDILFQL